MQMSNSEETFNSAIYSGEVWHKRYVPREHNFRYKVFMVYLDLQEIESVFSSSYCWSTRFSWWPAFYRREDYFTYPADESLSLDAAVRTAVRDELGFQPSGPIRLLTNLRYFGYLTNPISIYYCFDDGGVEVQALLIEVTNTPWGERQHYVLDCRNYRQGQAIDFDKQMHVSPFVPMNIRYQWSGNTPGDVLSYRLSNWLVNETLADEAGSGDLYFSAGVNFTRLPMSKKNMRNILIRFPLMTVKVITAIYWQAVRLKLKGIRFLSHPGRRKPSAVQS